MDKLFMTTNQVTERLTRAELKCVVFGEVLVDMFPDCVVPGGAPFNVAAHLAGLGFNPHFVSRWGVDNEASHIQRLAHRMGLNLSGVQSDLRKQTGRVSVVESGKGHIFQIQPDQAYDHIERDLALEGVKRYVGDRPAWLYFGTLALRSRSSRDSLYAIRQSLHARTFVDFNWRDVGPSPAEALKAVRQVSVLKLSDEELGLVLAWMDIRVNHATTVPAAGETRLEVQELISRLQVERLLVTYGADGAALWSADGVCLIHVGAAHVPVIQDTVGAGDAFSAIALAGFLEDEPLETLMQKAVAFASAMCGVRGALPKEAEFYRCWGREDCQDGLAKYA